MFEKLCQMLSIKKTQSSARHPQGNSQFEHFNLTLLLMVELTAFTSKTTVTCILDA
ncbi:hypothetical protein DPMN_135174 [Dreissena polymorpha]|uniref:Integrase catalytic domain-containing protein n=1 Tax=Dreissena polymorpha TaxID=45954 RepID=A0A9D4G117_DREPO|nr:hypothetical protein DPMN_135174 [Dreissena polymorpha]